ncbi:MAG: sensor histidine kinase [Paracoccaceae bacterium]
MNAQAQMPATRLAVGFMPRPVSVVPFPTAARSPGRREVGALSIIAHDLKGPLANLSLLIGALGIENAKTPADRRTGLTQRAERLIERLEQLLGGLIERERLFGDPLGVLPGDADLGDLVRTVVSCNEAAAERRFVRLQVRVSGDLPIRGDGELLMQAVDNLLSNAIRHTVPGGRVTVEASTVPSGDVEIRVRDEGRGLDDTEIARAFRPFVRLGGAGTPGPGGNGLGLWIVRLIAENHGGRISAGRNASGRGMTFALTLPRDGK